MGERKLSTEARCHLAFAWLSSTGKATYVSFVHSGCCKTHLMKAKSLETCHGRHGSCIGMSDVCRYFHAYKHVSFGYVLIL